MILLIATVVIALHIVLGLSLLLIPKSGLRALSVRMPKVFVLGDVDPDSPEEARVILFWRLLGGGALIVATAIAYLVYIPH
jgi:hypothetical protein